MAEKTTRGHDRIEIAYDEPRWRRLSDLRERSTEIMRILDRAGIRTLVHGSVARGDVDSKSDVDILIPYVVPSHKIELSLVMSGVELSARRISEATPSHAPKAHVYLTPEEDLSVTFPLLDFRSLELEFYAFGGMLNLKGLLKDRRVPGCTKRLTLIEPISTGHIESPVVGHESEVAKIVGVSVGIVRERVRVLRRRDEIGRTGTFLDVELGEDEIFESVLKAIVDENPAVRRLCRNRKRA